VWVYPLPLLFERYLFRLPANPTTALRPAIAVDIAFQPLKSHFLVMGYATRPSRVSRPARDAMLSSWSMLVVETARR